MLGACCAGLVGTAGLVHHELAGRSAIYLQSCMVIYPQPLPQLCEHYFYRYHPTRQEVNELNSAAGARFAFEARNEDEARRQLKRYLEAGVDINAVDKQTVPVEQGMSSMSTALHQAVLGSHVMEVRVLLDFGASKDIRDAKGRTALDLAREVRMKRPSPDSDQIVRMLERTEAKQK